MHIVQFGSIDVANYGDLLFPLIAAYRLSDLTTRMTLLAPLGGSVLRWPDSLPSEPADVALREGFACDACLVGGGDVVQANSTVIQDYAQDGITNRHALPSLWLGAALVAERTQARLIWNAPGVPRPFIDPRLQALVSSAVAANDYTSVRDPVSRRHLGLGDGGASVSVVPDTAVDVARLWPAPSLLPNYHGLFRARGHEVPKRAAVFHLNQWSRGRAEEIAASIARIADGIGCMPILLSIGLVHGDDTWVREVSAKLEVPHIAIDRPESLKDIAACLAHAVCYVGSSLHGFLTAFAYGNKGLIVRHPNVRKLDAVPMQLGLPDVACDSWADAEARLNAVLADPDRQWPAALNRAQVALDAHWTTIRKVLLAPLDEDSKARKTRFAQDLLAFNDENGGWIARLSGVLALEVNRHRPPVGGRLLDIDPLVVQGQPAHVSRNAVGLVLHPPSKGVTEVCFGRIPLSGGETIRGGVTVGHRQGHPVRFSLLLLDANGRTLAATEITAHPGKVLPWALAVPDAVAVPAHLFVSTRMDQPTDASHFAWATLIDPVVERLAIATRPAEPGL
ncbi:polysaccharide pyruvyl transferase family protein [Azospirillum isscasi]|uniref:Polysaccharide pyruvyl transferase family protein n=1 Tax=Azospirillum isscasi TaxID=3053926 RepID=A0ABU0WNE6_9PROT|nr:polysaccharide pyruvyl transferase family protein [Azospirillum isscasi]MDQ2105701.1 polysaccharide pyruvyl transferase family protein [Azospirillum isscasi]